MMVDLEDVIKVLDELLIDKSMIALRPLENVYLQYANIGIHEGVKQAKKKLLNHFEREIYS